jgi:hypothetical protein
MTYATDGQVSAMRTRIVLSLLFFRCAEELQGRAANVLDGRAGLIIIRACAVDLVEL